jgi:GDP-4-dehydro-6-deoxy-D-mannose reductase
MSSSTMSPMAVKKACVTGSSGFVGTHLCRVLHERGWQVLGLTSSKRSDPKGAETVVCDLRHDRKILQETFSRFQPTVVFHLAGESYVPRAEASFHDALSSNVGGTFEVVLASSLIATPVHVVLSSSSEVHSALCEAGSMPYDDTLFPLIVDEHTERKTRTHYGLTKILAEDVLLRFAGTSVTSAIVRPFNHIGPGQNDAFVVSSFARQVAEMKLLHREPVLAVGNLSSVRDFTDVRDICALYELIGVQRGEGTFTAGSGVLTPLSQIVECLSEVSGVIFEVCVDPNRIRSGESRLRPFAAKPLRAERELGWQRHVTLRQSVSDLYKYWYSNLSR